MEVTGACNLRCRMCLVRYSPAIGRGEGALAYEQFLELVEGLPDLRKLTLQGLGEPLLSPHLLDMVAHAAGRGIEVGFNTNATLLDPTTARRLVELGLGWLHVSLDGATAATYEDVRHGVGFAPRPGQFARVVGNVEQLLAIRRGCDTKLPRVQLIFVAMRRNVHELEALVELGGRLGIDEIFVQNLSHTFSDTDPAGDYAEIRRYAAEEALFDEDGRQAMDRAFSAARRTAERLEVKLRLPGPGQADGRRAPGQPGCSWPWDSAYVTHRGVVQPCCMVMGSDRARMGDLGQQDFAEVWRGGPYRSFRAGLLENDPPAVCQGCSLYRGVF